MNILWVGPGTGTVQPFWPATINQLMGAGMPVRSVVLLDRSDTPKNPFPHGWMAEHGIDVRCLRGDFFEWVAPVDVVIVDFVESWALGGRYWSLHETPWRKIKKAWRDQLLEVAQFQVWVRHDALPASTVQPNLGPPFELVLHHDPIASETWIDPSAAWWSEAALVSQGMPVDVWQRKALRDGLVRRHKAR